MATRKDQCYVTFSTNDPPHRVSLTAGLQETNVFLIPPYHRTVTLKAKDAVPTDLVHQEAQRREHQHDRLCPRFSCVTPRSQCILGFTEVVSLMISDVWRVKPDMGTYNASLKVTVTCHPQQSVFSTKKHKGNL